MEGKRKGRILLEPLVDCGVCQDSLYLAGVAGQRIPSGRVEVAGIKLRGMVGSARHAGD